MENITNVAMDNETIKRLCEEYVAGNSIDRQQYIKYNVKRGLRNEDSTGVMAGLTKICRVHGYIIEDGDKKADEGRLIYRGIDVQDIVNGAHASGNYSFEETVWLLLFGNLPNKEEYKEICEILGNNRALPQYFLTDVVLKNPSKEVMNKMARALLTLYSFDDEAEDLSLENNMRQSFSLIAKLPVIMAYAYQVKRRHYYNQSIFIHQIDPTLSTAESILSIVRDDQQYTKEEALVLDMCLTLHAEHGGGNNSTFTTRVLTSSHTDIYSTIAAAIGSLKGYKHGGANKKVDEMMKMIMENVKDWTNDDEIYELLAKIVRKEVGDKNGLIYGMGHAVYTKSDPRTVILKEKARALAKEKGYDERLALYERVERLSPLVFADIKKSDKVICANVDFYSGLVYEMLGLPQDIYTGLFAVARMAGWCAHRIEELHNGDRIIRPAYRALHQDTEYTPIDER